MPSVEIHGLPNGKLPEDVARGIAMWKGEFDESKDYIPGNLVVLNGMVCMALQESKGRYPDSTTPIISAAFNSGTFTDYPLHILNLSGGSWVVSAENYRAELTGAGAMAYQPMKSYGELGLQDIVAASDEQDVFIDFAYQPGWMSGGYGYRLDVRTGELRRWVDNTSVLLGTLPTPSVGTSIGSVSASMDYEGNLRFAVGYDNEINVKDPEPWTQPGPMGVTFGDSATGVAAVSAYNYTEYQNPYWSALNSPQFLGRLVDVSGIPDEGQILMFSGGMWRPTNLPSA